MKTNSLVLFALLFTIAGVILFSWFASRDFQRFNENQYWINRTNQVLRQLDNIQTLVITEESGVRGYTISANPIFLWDLPDAHKNILATVDKTTALLTDNPAQQVRLQQLRKHILDKVSFQQQVIAFKKAFPDSSESLHSSLTGKKLMDQVAAQLMEMKTIENKLLQDRITNNKLAAQQSLQNTLAGAFFATLFIVFLLWRLNKDSILRQKAEVALQKSEARYNQFVENAGVVTYTADQSGRFTFISNQVEALTGYLAEELLGRHFTVLIPADWTKPVAEKYYFQFSNLVRETTLVFPIIHKHKGIRWVEQDAFLVLKTWY